MSKPGDGLSAPIPKSRDDGPLGPDKLAEREMTARQAIAAYDNLVRLARNPDADATYRPIVRRLMELAADCAGEMATAKAQVDASAEVAGLVAKLDMGQLENISALAAARQDAIADAQALDKLEGILATIRSRLSRPNRVT